MRLINYGKVGGTCRGEDMIVSLGFL